MKMKDKYIWMHIYASTYYCCIEEQTWWVKSLRENLTCWPHLSLLAHCQVYKSSSFALVCSIYLFLPIVSLGAQTLHAVVVATPYLPSPSTLATLKAALSCSTINTTQQQKHAKLCLPKSLLEFPVWGINKNIIVLWATHSTLSLFQSKEQIDQVKLYLTM